MRASSLLLLTSIFTAAELPLHILGVTGKCENPKLGDNFGQIPADISYEENGRFRMPCKEGYVRQAGTSNLFRCLKETNKYSWSNNPQLKCKPDPKKRSTPDTTIPTMVTNTQNLSTAPNPILSTRGTVEVEITTPKTGDTSTTPGQTSFTTTHTVTTTAGTFHHTSLRTTTKEEEPIITTSSVTLSSSSTLTDRINLTTVSPKSSSSSTTTNTISTNTGTTTNTNSRTTTSTGGGDKGRSYANAGGIAAGTVLSLIVIAGSATGIFIWCRRRDVSSTGAEMTMTAPGVNHPLLDTASSPISCPGSTPASAPDSAPDSAPESLIVVQNA